MHPVTLLVAVNFTLSVPDVVTSVAAVNVGDCEFAGKMVEASESEGSSRISHK